MEKTEKDVFSNGYIEIHDNTLKFQSNIVQLKNIERISISPIDAMQVPQWAYICLIAGVVVLAINVFVGIILCLIGGGYAAYIHSENNSLGFYLRIELSSGKSLYFDAKDKKFLSEIMNIIGNCFNKSQQNITIDMKNSKIGNVQVGDGNMINHE